MPASSSATQVLPRSTPSPHQLGFDFQSPLVTALPTSSTTPSPDTPSSYTPSSYTPITALPPSPQSLMDPPVWRAPPPLITPEHGMDALAMACCIQNAELASALMELPEQWDFNAPHKPDVGFIKGFPSALTHLLYCRHTHYLSEHNDPPGFDLTTSTALAMVERGADFLQMTDLGVTPITLCASARREEFFEHLIGHPRFTYALMAHLRMGELHSTSDSRTPLLGHLIEKTQLRAVTALVVHAGFPLNTCDANGRLPIGYCQTLQSLDKLISLGALPGMDDLHGRNALSRIQLITDTETRDKMITRVAKELKKDAKSNPSIMATLQSQNIAALLEAAQHAPKSSLLKTINAFNFDVSRVRDPKTLITPLMAACKGGRMASAQHLLAAGSNINAVDAQGIPASAYLLAGYQGSNGPDCVDVAASYAHLIDFSLCSHRGFPVALEAAFMMGSRSSQRHVSHDATSALRTSLLSFADSNKPSYVCGPHGLSLIESYTLGYLSTRNLYYQTSLASSLLDISTRYAAPDSLDRALLSLFKLHSNSNNIFDRYQSYHSFLDKLETLILSTQPSCTHTARFVQTKGVVLSQLAKSRPELYAHIEKSALALTCELQPMATRPRSRL